MDYRIVAVGLTFTLGALDFLSEGHFMRTKGIFKQRLVSFAAGTSVAYLFLHLFPQLYYSILVEEPSYQQLTFFLMMIGFISYHVIGKWFAVLYSVVIAYYHQRIAAQSSVSWEWCAVVFYRCAIIGGSHRFVF